MKGIVFKSTGNFYTVKSDKGTYECRIKGKLRLSGLKSTNPLAVGDIVFFEPAKKNTGQIYDIEERKNYIVRKSINLSKQSHIIAANIDRVMLIITLKDPQTLPAFIDRFLVAAESFRIPVTIIINKTDTYDDKLNAMATEMKKIYAPLGYPVIECSAKTGTGIKEIATTLKGKLTLLAGHSGVGKSTLINKIEPGLQLKTADISAYHKAGKHTTTFAEIYELSLGGKIIDTPGIRAFGLYDIDKSNLGHYFPEIRVRMNNCKYHNCKHISEPGCAIKAAVEKGEISIMRYQNYIAMYEDKNEVYRNDIHAE